MTMMQVAVAMGYSGQSSYQRFENPDTYTKRAHLELSEVRKLSDVLAGVGTPKIERSEIYRLLDLNETERGLLTQTSQGQEAYSGEILREVIFYLQAKNAFQGLKPEEAAELVSLCCDVLNEDPESTPSTLASVISIDLARRRRKDGIGKNDNRGKQAASG